MYYQDPLRRLGALGAYTAGARGALVFRRRKQRRSLQFRLPEIKRMLARAMTRRERGSGYARKLAHTLIGHGRCGYESWDSQNETRCGLLCLRTDHNSKAYRVYVWGESSDKLLARLNEKWDRALMLQASCALRETQRQSGLYTPRIRGSNPRPKQDNKLRRHFRRSTSTWQDAIAIIAHATGKDAVWVNRRLQRALNERDVALIRVKTFVYQLILIGGYSGVVPLCAPVEFWTTNDNTRSVYRKTRNKLRQSLKRERKEKVRVRKQVRAWREQKRRIRALVAI